MAAGVALEGDKIRDYLLGAVGIRSDGAVVVSRNSPVRNRFRQAHAEHKLSKKLDVGATVFVSRIDRLGNLGMAKPCPDCMKVLVSRGVKRVYYTIGNNEHGTITI